MKELYITVSYIKKGVPQVKFCQDMKTARKYRKQKDPGTAAIIRVRRISPLSFWGVVEKRIEDALKKSRNK